MIAKGKLSSGVMKRKFGYMEKKTVKTWIMLLYIFSTKCSNATGNSRSERKKVENIRKGRLCNLGHRKSGEIVCF